MKQRETDGPASPDSDASPASPKNVKAATTVRNDITPNIQVEP